MTRARPSLAPLGRLGRYRLIECIGWGGTAEVFTAVLGGMAGFEKKVVLKRLHRHLQGDAQYEQLFVDEAKRAAGVHHPQIVQTYELQRDPQSNALFMVLEHIDGVDLRTLIRQQDRPLPVDLVVWLATKLLQGLAHLNLDAPKLVHCDVTPENIFLSVQGDVKLGDFGMATDVDRPGSPFPGRVLGKVPYMSPEQAAGRALDARSDVFSAAVLLWEALTQSRLFQGATVAQTAERLRSAPRPPASQFNPEVPASLDAVLDRALRVDASARPVGAAELRAELLEILMAMAPARNDAHYRPWLGGLVKAAQNQPPDASVPVDPPSIGAEASSFASVPTGPVPGSPPLSGPGSVGSSDSSGSSTRVVPPSARVEAADLSPSTRASGWDSLSPSPSQPEAHFEPRHLAIPMPGQPAQIETHELVKRNGEWDVRASGTGQRLWVRGGRSVWGPFSLEPTITRLVRLPEGALKRVSLSRDGQTWHPLTALVEAVGLRLVPEDAHLPQARLQGRLEDFDLVSVLGFLERHRGTGRLIVVQETEAGQERRDIDVRDGELVAVHANASTLRAAVARVLNPSEPEEAHEVGVQQDLTEMLAWTSGRIMLDEACAPTGPALHSLCWRLPGRLHRAVAPAALRAALDSAWDTPLVRTPRFDATTADMGLLGWEAACLEPFGHGFSISESVVQQSGVREQSFAVALANVLVRLGLLVTSDGWPAVSSPLARI